MTDRLVFREEDHTYTLDGSVVPGVTTALSVVTDFSNIPPSVLEKARDRGTAVHRAVDLHLKDDLDEASLHPDVAVRFYQFLRFCRETGFVVEMGEHRVFSDRYKYAGTLDLVGMLGGKRVLIDIKSTFALPATAAPQTAAYESALREMLGFKRELPRYALQLKEDAYVLQPLRDRFDFRVFLACLTAYNWRVNNGL